MGGIPQAPSLFQVYSVDLKNERDKKQRLNGEAQHLKQQNNQYQQRIADLEAENKTFKEKVLKLEADVQFFLLELRGLKPPPQSHLGKTRSSQVSSKF
jgi:chromosome segregation ATPase